MIIKPKKYSGLVMALLIEFIMIIFYINAISLKMLLIEFGISLVIVFGIVIMEGKVIILDEYGCCLSWMNGVIKKKYNWQQLKTKRILYKTDQRESYGFEAQKGVLLSPKTIKQNSIWNNPFVQSEIYIEVEKGQKFVDNFPFAFKPVNIIYIYILIRKLDRWSKMEVIVKWWMKTFLWLRWQNGMLKSKISNQRRYRHGRNFFSRYVIMHFVDKKQTREMKL